MSQRGQQHTICSDLDTPVCLQFLSKTQDDDNCPAVVSCDNVMCLSVPGTCVLGERGRGRGGKGRERWESRPWQGRPGIGCISEQLSRGPGASDLLLRRNAGAESWLDATADGSASLGLARLQNRWPGLRGPAHCSDDISSCLYCDHTDTLSILKGTRHFCEFSSSIHSPTGAALRTKSSCMSGSGRRIADSSQSAVRAQAERTH